MKQTEWILCPVWGSETRIRIREDTAARTRRLKTDFAEQKAEEQGYKEIVIWAFKNNHHAVSFYKKRGYSIDKEEYLSEPYFSMGIRLKKDIG